MGFKQYSNEQNNDTEKQVGNQVENLYNTYKGKNEDELLAELVKHVAKQKENGTFDYNNLEKMLSKVMPFLNEQQKQKLNDVLKQIQNM